MNDVELARLLAWTAGRILLDVQRSGLLAGVDLGATGDRLAGACILDGLRVHRPQDAILCEDEQDSATRLSARRVWIIDPLDGTREYGEGRDDWAVHVGLAIDGLACEGAVALPALGRVLCSGSGLARCATSRPDRRCRMLVSRSRPAAEALAVAAALGADVVPMGSAGAKTMAVVRGEADVYLHSGGQYEWDSAAPVAVARAAGLHVSRIDGRAPRYNRADPSLPDLLVCRPELAQRVLDLVARAACAG